MTKEEAIAEAREQSLDGCGYHVNYNVRGNYYYVSDWYDCDSTVATLSKGELV
jgi:hypothetical protein